MSKAILLDDEYVSAHLPWASFTLVRVLPERAKFIAQSDKQPEVTPVAFVLVSEPMEKVSAYRLAYAFSVGRDQSPADTAVRSLQEDADIIMPLSRLKLVNKWIGGLKVTHWKCLFSTDIYESDRDRIKPDFRGSEGQGPVFLSPIMAGEMMRQHRFLTEHRTRLIGSKLIPDSVLLAA